MKKILTAKEMYLADTRQIERGGTPSQTLMERAAKAALLTLKKHFDTSRVLFLCGNGNNGGDGFAMARFLAEEGCRVLICCPLFHGDIEGELSVEAARQYRLLPIDAQLCTTPSLEGVSAVVDALFGIGLSRPIEGELAALLQRIREAAIPVLAVDIPSGVCADSGRILGTALPATHTVTMAAYKPGHLLYPGAGFCGEITVADIGVDVPSDASGFLLEREDLALLPARPPRAHKGTFGRVLVIGGSVGMSGAGYLCAKAAYRAGAGLVEIYAPEENRIIYQTQLPEALLTLYDPQAPDRSKLRQAIERADAIAIGMGLGTGNLTTALLETVLSHTRVPLLLDADALNELALSPYLFPKLSALKVPVVITPHLGEASRLLECSIPFVSSDLYRSAQLLRDKTNATVVLKDARTVIFDGQHFFVNTYGNSGMATGGSGDVLAGIIAAFLAAKAPARIASTLGVLTHALAGDHALSRLGSHAVMASDIVDNIGSVLP